MSRLSLFLVLVLAALTCQAQQDHTEQTAPKDSATMKSDTLHSIVVTANGTLPFQLNPYPYGIMPHTRSLSDILGSSAMDKMLHPFAIKQRKDERHRKKMRKILADYDRVKTNNELLREALRNEGIDPDSLLMQKTTAQ